MDAFLGQPYSDHVTLTALDHVGVKLGMFVGDRSAYMPYNKWASKVAQNLKRVCKVATNLRVCGPAVLYCDTGDFTTEKWTMIQETIKCKKLRNPPEHVITYIAQLEQRDMSEFDALFQELAELTQPRIDTYGLCI